MTLFYRFQLPFRWSWWSCRITKSSNGSDLAILRSDGRSSSTADGSWFMTATNSHKSKSTLLLFAIFLETAHHKLPTPRNHPSIYTTLWGVRGWKMTPNLPALTHQRSDNVNHGKAAAVKLYEDVLKGIITCDDGHFPPKCTVIIWLQFENPQQSGFLGNSNKIEGHHWLIETGIPHKHFCGGFSNCNSSITVHWQLAQAVVPFQSLIWCNNLTLLTGRVGGWGQKRTVNS